LTYAGNCLHVFLVDADAVYRALADPTRRRLLDLLHEQPGRTLGELCEGIDMRRQSVSQHLDVLEAAGLVTTHRVGRRKLHHLNAVPIHEIQRRWIHKFEEPRLAALDAIKQQAEEAHMTDQSDNQSAAPVPDFVYTTYIRATPDEVWRALTDADLTVRYWGHAQVSDWAVGSTVEHVRADGSGAIDAVGRVVTFDPPHCLAFGFDEPHQVDTPGFEPSLVTFVLEAGDDIVRLTVTHTGLRSPGDREAIGNGWPAVLANLKTFLETGDALPQAPWTLAPS
jgi:DNA-binding transcriptional ArsR family regulator/uncharacterized protein YndB with AHSA1/START domain